MRQNVTKLEHLHEMRELFKSVKKNSPRPERINMIIEIYKKEIRVKR